MSGEQHVACLSERICSSYLSLCLQLAVWDSCRVNCCHQSFWLWEKEVDGFRYQQRGPLHVLQGHFLHLTQLTSQRPQQALAGTEMSQGKSLTLDTELFMEVDSNIKLDIFYDETYSLIVSLLVVQTTQSTGRVVDRKCDFWIVLLRVGAETGPVFVTSIIRRRLMTLWMTSLIYIKALEHTHTHTHYEGSKPYGDIIRFKADTFTRSISRLAEK